MNSPIKSLFIVVLALFVVLATLDAAEAGYRKPPFNGSIFGKRGNSVEYEAGAQKLQAMCEIASEACQQWFTSDK
uniref:CSON003391 protein n=1 Tax=Culicoides sonorensis TaxID=179676 RepID=A0A336MLL6_CULSO